MLKHTLSCFCMMILMASVSVADEYWTWFSNSNWTKKVASYDVPGWGKADFVCTNSGGLMIRTPEEEWTYYTYSEGLSGHRVKDVCMYANTVYVTVWGGGLLRFVPPDPNLEMGSFEFASDHKTQWYADMQVYNESIFMVEPSSIREYIPDTGIYVNHPNICSSPKFRGMVNCDDKLWVVKNNRVIDKTTLLSYDGLEWDEYDFPLEFDVNSPNITGLAVSGDMLCVGTNTKGILGYDCVRDYWSVLDYNNDSKNIYKLTNAIEPNTVWAITNQGYIHLNFDDNSHEVYLLPDSVGPRDVAHINVSSDNTLWASTNGKGVFYREEGVWKSHYHQTDFPFNRVVEVEEVNETIWCIGPASQNLGIAAFRENQWEHYTPENSNLLTGRITDIDSDTLDIIAASNEGICWFDRQSQIWEIYAADNVPVFESNRFSCVAVDPNRLYAGSNNNVYRMDRPTKQWINLITFEDQTITHLSSFKDSQLIVATNDDKNMLRVYIAILDPNGVLRPYGLTTGRGRFPASNPSLLIEKNDVSLWHINNLEGYSVFAMDSSGFWMWNGSELSGPIVPDVLRWKNKTRNLGLDCEGRFWVGNYGGLYRQTSPDVLGAGQWESVAPGRNVIQSLVYVNDIAHNDHSVWIASSEGLWWYLNTCSEDPGP